MLGGRGVVAPRCRPTRARALPPPRPPPHLHPARVQGGPKGEGGLDDATGSNKYGGGASMKQTSAAVDLSEFVVLERGPPGDESSTRMRGRGLCVHHHAHALHRLATQPQAALTQRAARVRVPRHPPRAAVPCSPPAASMRDEEDEKRGTWGLDMFKEAGGELRRGGGGLRRGRQRGPGCRAATAGLGNRCCVTRLAHPTRRPLCAEGLLSLFGTKKKD